MANGWFVNKGQDLGCGDGRKAMQVEDLPSTHSRAQGVCSTVGGLYEESLKVGLQRPTETMFCVQRGHCMHASREVPRAREWLWKVIQKRVWGTIHVVQRWSGAAGQSLVQVMRTRAWAQEMGERTEEGEEQGVWAAPPR